VKFIEILLGYIHVFVLPISRDVPGRLLTILKTSPVRGPHVFKLFTYNGADFRQFADLELFEPAHASLLT
jgi:hypothetical protein